MSGPQGKVVPHTILDDPSAWTAESLKGKEEEYTWTLTKKDVKDIITAVEKITRRLPPTEESVKGVRPQPILSSLNQNFIDGWRMTIAKYAVLSLVAAYLAASPHPGLDVVYWMLRR